MNIKSIENRLLSVRKQIALREPVEIVCVEAIFNVEVLRRNKAFLENNGLMTHPELASIYADVCRILSDVDTGKELDEARLGRGEYTDVQIEPHIIMVCGHTTEEQEGHERRSI